MRKQELALALLGFLAGAATFAGGGEDPDLVERLRALQRSAERVILTPSGATNFAPEQGTDHEFSLLAVSDLTGGVVDHLPPTLGYLDEEDETPLFGGQVEEVAQPFGTIEEVTELIRTSVETDAWETGTISASGNILDLWQTPDVIARVQLFLDRLRARAFLGVSVGAQIVEVPAELHRQLAAGGPARVNDARMETLNQALASGRARVLFLAHAHGFNRQRFLVSHGGQHAVLSDADVEVAQTSRTTDPLVDVLQTGGFLSVRPSVGDDRSRVTLDLEVRFQGLELPIRSRETETNGLIDMPALDRSGFRTVLAVPAGRWALAGVGGVGARVRLLLVKATLVDARGGAR